MGSLGKNGGSRLRAFERILLGRALIFVHGHRRSQPELAPVSCWACGCFVEYDYRNVAAVFLVVGKLIF